MATTRSTSEEILRTAERMARARGYNGFSFRDIAGEIGIKSASVHYHFPTKADLSAALMAQYSDRFFGGLGDPEAPDDTPPAHLRGYLNAFRQYLVADTGMCLGGLFAAERGTLPEPVAAEVRAFFERSRIWLARVIAHNSESYVLESEARRQALAIIATVEGALLTARALGDITVFDDIVRSLQRRAPLAIG